MISEEKYVIIFTIIFFGVLVMNITERFLKYVSFPTMSDESSDTVPTTAKQLALSKYIADELFSLGLSDVELDDKGYL